MEEEERTIKRKEKIKKMNERVEKRAQMLFNKVKLENEKKNQ